MERRPIECLPGYDITDTGQVINRKTGRVLKQRLQRGYCKISVSISGKVHNKRVHRLVAHAFIDNPLDLPEVDHIDRIRNNNNVSNLRWVTQEDNRKNKKIPAPETLPQMMRKFWKRVLL